MANDDFVSFEHALRDLNMRSEELRKLVSEGEIRAFRDGSSMKFKREDVTSLHAGAELDDTLEDDTGMVTEELSDEDTLLVADDDEFEDLGSAPVAAAAATSVAATSRSARVRAQDDAPSTEPGWVTAAAILGAVVMVYGFMVVYSLATESAPTGLTTLLSFK